MGPREFQSKGCLLLVLVAFSSAAFAQASSFAISNVRASQRQGTKLVDVWYDLQASGANNLTVRLEVSTNGGFTYASIATTLTGAVGSGMVSGINKNIAWDAGADWNGRFSANLRFRVTATDVQELGKAVIGQISLGGVAVLDGPLGTANGFTAFNNVYIVPLPAPSGAYAGIAGGVSGQVTFAPFLFNPLLPNPVDPVWEFSDAGTGWTYAFKLSSVSIVTQNMSFLNLLGFGSATITGPGSPYTETPGVWAFTIDNPSGSFPPDFHFNFISTRNNGKASAY